MAQQKAVETVEEVDDLIDELQPGVKLLKGQYTITRFINSGGFGITYLAKDSLDRDVVIKECFPSSVCRRSKVVVAARSRAHTAELRSIVQLFVREARNLSKIVHPNIVAVHQVFEDNGTAYMAIDFIDGLDLQQIIDGEGEKLSPDHIVRITDKLLAAVGYIHAHDMLHRDISPDNVLLNKVGEPILIDFGAAREQASKTNRAMSALRVVKDGYSPQEFYIAGSEQGPWSDLYALAATLYHVISGDAPVSGQARLGALAEDRPDPYVPLTGRFPGFPEGYLEAIDRALSTLPKQRLQTAADWLAMYHGAPATAEAPAPVAGLDDAVHRLVSDFQRETSVTVPETVVPAAEPAPVKTPSRAPEAEAAPIATRPVAASSGRNPIQMLAGVAVALVLVGGAYMFLGKPQTPVAGTSLASAAPAVPTAAPAVAAPAPAAASLLPEPAAPATAAVSAEVEDAEAAALSTPPESAGAAAATATDDGPEPAVEINAPVSDPAPIALATAPEATEAEQPEPLAPETVAVAPVEPAVAQVAASAASRPAANQVAFAAWDVEMPFVSDDRLVDGTRIAVITRLVPGIDAKAAGDWLAPGVTIHAINGVPVDSSRSITLAVMNVMSVDPDGRARVVVDYTDRTRQRKTGLLTVGAVRLVSLQNGLAVRNSVVDGVWTSVVTAVGRPEMTSLKPGDTLFRDKTTSLPFDGPTSLEQAMAELVRHGTVQTELSIIRDSKVAAAMLQLTSDGGR